MATFTDPALLALEAKRKRLEARYGQPIDLNAAKRHQAEVEQLLANRAKNFKKGTRGWDAISKSIEREIKLAERALGKDVKITASIERSYTNGIVTVTR